MKKKREYFLARICYHRELKAKIQKFKKLNYTNVSEKDLLQYLLEFRWKYKKDWSIYKKKKDLSVLKVNEYFDYLSLKAKMSQESIEDVDFLNDLF
jgi:hypothetical protein